MDDTYIYLFGSLFGTYVLLLVTAAWISHAGAAASVAQLKAVLDDNPSLAVRQRAAWALGKIGIAAKSAEASLRKASASNDPRLSRLANQSLAEINSR